MPPRGIRIVVGIGLAATTLLWLALTPRDDGARAQSAPPTVQDRTTAIESAALLDDVRLLASREFEGRRPGTAGHATAVQFIEGRFRGARLDAVDGSYLRPFAMPRRAAPGERRPGDSGSIAGTNIVGRCPTMDERAPAMLVGAHYDHLGVVDGVVYPGADDNASGVAVLLALAETCGRIARRHTVWFVAFDAEETGLAGARAFVADPPFPLDALSVMVNLDMVGRSDRRELFVAGLSHSPHLRPLLERVRARAPLTVRFGHDTPGPPGYDWTQMSDHGPFHDAGVPFVYFGVEDHPDYHQPTDTADRIDGAFLREVALTVLDAIAQLDSALPPRARSK